MLHETRDAIRRERLRMVQDLDQLLAKRVAMHAACDSGQERLPDGTADVESPAAGDVLLDGGLRPWQLPTEATDDAHLRSPGRVGRDQPLPNSASLQLATLEPRAAAGSVLAADTQPLSARSRQSSRARRPQPPQPDEQKTSPDAAPGVDAGHVHNEVSHHFRSGVMFVSFMPAILLVMLSSCKAAELELSCRMCSLRAARSCSL